MSEPSDQTNATDASAVQRQTLLRDLDQWLEEGVTVFDLNGETVGGVNGYSTASGYLMVGSGGFNSKSLFIPFRFIERINEQGIYLTLLKDALARQYGEPPVTQTVVENRFVPGPHGDTLPQAVEVQIVQSGYDGAPLTVGSVELGDITERLSVGLVVYDVDGVRLGDIAQYDNRRRLLVIEKGIFNPTMTIVPFSVIDRIDREKLSVFLTIPKDQLQTFTDS
ncbi:MAG TPA: hypothetical protein VGP82_08635 [Ktedonobacterales bacterium]|jgi:hypothetical protein|nr:hypothetical protein [Ktedonobacterales bacterium]